MTAPNQLAKRLILGVSIAALALLTTRRAHASFCAPPSPPAQNTPPNPNNSAPCGQCRDNCSASPCFAKSGVYTTTATDLEIPTNGFSLEVSRVYESSQVVDGPLGYGWRSNFGSRLYYATYLITAPSTYVNEAVVIMPDGESYRFRENGGTFTPPTGSRNSLVRLADGTYRFTIARSEERYDFAADGALVTMKDEYGNTLRFSHDASRRIARVDDESGTGRYLIVTWNPSGRIGSVQDNAGRVISYAYGSDGTLTDVTNAANQTTTYAYEQRRFAPQLVEVKDHWDRVITAVTWDSLDRVSTYTEEGERYTMTYYPGDLQLSPRTFKAHSKGTDTILFDTMGLVTSRGDGTTSVYSTHGDLLSMTNARNRTTAYTYLSDGRASTVTVDSGGLQSVTFHYTYDANYPLKVAKIEPRMSSSAASNYHGHHLGWKYTYYAPGDTSAGSLPGALKQVNRLAYQHNTTTVLTLDTDPVSLYSTFSYDAKGRVTKSWNRQDGETTISYDDAANTQTVTRPANNVFSPRQTVTTTDSVGRVVSVEDALDNVTTYAYDNLDRITTVTLPKPSASSTANFVHTTTYDQLGSDPNLVYTHVTDANGRVTKQGHDQFGRLVQSIDAAGNTTTYAYTAGLLTSSTDANGNVTSYTYDSSRRLKETIFPDGKKETNTYYQDGLLNTKTDRKGVVTTYTYDGYNRLATQTTSGKTLTLTYEGEKLKQVTDTYAGTSELTIFTHDPKTFLVLSEIQGQSSNGITTVKRGKIDYTWSTSTDWLRTYKVTDGLESRTPPEITYTYYGDGSLRKLEWGHSSGDFFFSYDANGQQTGISFPNGQTREYTYDNQGRLTKVRNLFNSSSLATFEYEYDKDQDTGQFTVLGQRTKSTAIVPSITNVPTITQYFYDAKYQLVKAKTTSPSATEKTWTYDAIGNRLTQVAGSTTSYTYVPGSTGQNSSRLATAGVNNVTHDFNGNMTIFGGIVNTFDVLDRMTSRNTGSMVTFKYDWQNRRVALDHQSTTYVYKGSDPVTITYTKNGGYYLADYLYGPGIDTPLSRADYFGKTYYAVDGLGSVILLTDEQGVVKNKYAYGPWGEVQSATEPIVQPFAYTGREFAVLDPGTSPSMYYYRARYMDPTIGRFLAEDPLRTVDPAYVPRYDYVLNDPLNAVDPDGYCSVRISAPVERLVQRVNGVGAPCGQGRNPACSTYGGNLTCYCKCVGPNTWAMAVGMTVSLTMYLPSNATAARLDSLRNHEYRHLGDMRGRFTLRCAELESKRYPTEKKCRKDCQKASNGFQNWIQAAGRESNDHVHQTHPDN